MNVLERYVLKRVLLQAAAASAASFGIVWTIQALTKVNLVTDSGQSTGAFLFLATLLLPAIIPIVLPFAVLIATTNSLNGLNTDSELAVIHAAGAPRSSVFRPIMIVAIIASLLTILSGSLIEPYSRQRARSLVAEARADLISLVIQEGSFKKVDDNIYMQVAKRLPNGLLGGLFIADSRDPKSDFIYYAQEGAILRENDTSLLVMKDGEIHSRNVTNGQISIIRFTSYAFDLSQFSASTSKPTLLPKDQTTDYLLSPDANDKVFQQNPLLFSAELHKRGAEWLYPLAFAMIGMAVCGMARSHRENPAFLTFHAISLAFVLRWLGLFAEDSAEKTTTANLFVYLVPLAGIAIAAWFIARNRTLAKAKQSRFSAEALVDAAGPILARLRGRLSALSVRRKGGAS
ncbi:MAG: LptF/LptG family permease [Rhizobiaceae bacterium]